MLVLLGCGTPEVEGDFVFLRDAIFVDGEVVPTSWSPGQQLEHEGRVATAPHRAECITLFGVGLGDVSREVAMGLPAPDTALAFSPDGSLLAVGSYRGEVLVLDGWTGEVVADKQLSETMVKFVAWSADGQTLYAAEQSPDAFVHAFDPRTLEVRWSFRVADEVESSPLPPAEEKYGVYDLPAAFGMAALHDGGLVMTAMHGWNTPEGRRNASRVLRLDADGKLVDAWPEAGVADATFKHPRVDLEGDRIVFAVHRTASGEAPTDLPIGGIQVLSLSGLEPVVSVIAPALEPWYDTPFVWEALDVDGDAVFMGFGDGRVLLFGQDGTERLALTPGTPILSGEVPIAASVGYGQFAGDLLIFQTSTTLIPWGAASPELRPPSTHPRENALWVHDLDGELSWTWTGEQELAGLTVLGDTLVAGAGPRSSDSRADLYGALIFELSGEGSGDERLRAFCPTEGPAFFRQTLTEDGRVAVTEFPYADEGGQHGTYRVTVLR